MAKKRFYDLTPSPQNLRAIWDRLHGFDDQVTAANATIRQQADTIAALQSGLTNASRNALQALIAAGKTTTQQQTTTGQSGGSGGSGGGGGGAGGGGTGGGGNPPPPGTGVCSGQPFGANLPAWLTAELLIAGQPADNNCLNEALLGAANVEAAINANDFTVQHNSGCGTRARLYHQGNHGLWVINPPGCGAWDASAVADYIVNLSVRNADGSDSWGWS